MYDHDFIYIYDDFITNGRHEKITYELWVHQTSVEAIPLDWLVERGKTETVASMCKSFLQGMRA